MSQFDESKVARATDGKFAEKPPSAEAAVELTDDRPAPRIIRPGETLTDPADLEALPAGSIVLTPPVKGDPWKKHENGEWDGGGYFDDGSPPDLPVQVLHVPAASQPVESLQTQAPLQRDVKNTFNVTASSFYDLSKRGQLEMDQHYQRGHVWGTDRRRKLIKSIYESYPMAPIMMNDRFTARFRDESMSEDERGVKAVVDGKQRVTSMLMYRNDELDVPASWFPAENIEGTPHETDDGPYVYYSDLNRQSQARFDMAPIATVEFTIDSIEKEEEVFDRFNFGGVAQGDTDLD